MHQPSLPVGSLREELVGLRSQLGSLAGLIKTVQSRFS